jgi:hypothetical protein
MKSCKTKSLQIVFNILAERAMYYGTVLVEIDGHQSIIYFHSIKIGNISIRFLNFKYYLAIGGQVNNKIIIWINK